MVSRLFDGSRYVELNVRECGREICLPNKIFDFTPKDYHLFHYIFSGAGTFATKDKTYRLHRGDIFYIGPGEHPHYSPDPHDPWSYLWLGFGGESASALVKAAGFDADHPIAHGKNAAKGRLEAIYSQHLSKGYFDLVCLGEAYAFFGDLAEGRGNEDAPRLSQAEEHIQAAKEYILNNYQFPISIDDVANNVGVTPNYLANIFAKFERTSPKKFLIETRMRNAALLFKTGSRKIGEVAEKIGYANQLHFSSEFKRFYGVSPLAYIKGGCKE